MALDPHPFHHAADARDVRAGRRFALDDFVDATVTSHPESSIACAIQIRLEHAIP